MGRRISCSASPARTCLFIIVAAVVLTASGADRTKSDGAPAWAPGRAVRDDETLSARIVPPPGFDRVAAAPSSWAAWLRKLPMKPANAPVLIYTGSEKARQDVHVAVIDMDVGTKDLQQCADAIMRLRAE